MSTAIVCQHSMSDVMNKVEMCGKGINTSQASIFLHFIVKKQTSLAMVQGAKIQCRM